MAPSPGTAPEDRPTAELLLASLCQLAGCDRAAILLAPGEEQPSPDLTAAVLSHPQTLAASSPDTALPFAEDRLLVSRGFHSRLYLPLVCRGRALGVLALAWRAPAALGEEAVGRLRSLAELAALALDGEHERARAAELRSRLEREAGYLRAEVKGQGDLRTLAGEGAAMKAVRQAVQQVAATDSTVLITGETGTGKELVARAIHQLSPRRDRLLVSVNCAALAPGVIASELFGHEAGAFTGAGKRRLGRFELAQGGTVFLDEVGEVPPEAQVLLLRVLQERVIERVGGGVPIAIDVRVIAATNRDLQAAVAAGRFRADLYYRLNVFPVHVPPLRQRREDIPGLVQHFVRQFNRRMNKEVAHVEPASLVCLQEYDWPGNVRELENVIERAMIVAPGDALVIDPSWLRVPGPNPTDGAATLAELERRAIVVALERCGGRIYGPAGAAAALGVKPTTLYGKMRRFGIPRRQP
jgi:formate hydrogenlyase transcriptional activator